MNPLVLMLGVVGCGPTGMEQPWPALDEGSRAGQDWCALAQVLVENVDSENHKAVTRIKSCRTKS